ncbi:hypothetical protein UCRPC4_g04323 [Phaeomoniella chlamydospora]|uniref:MARVEL domain-containing protein n=1 Tax=Phaeomoniella chlamydospora TaxID=158046 RepID=A0A0G2GT92_PHACM|nr:hypothetical protein UCRPC4_g04323 [Phaeomoniella chlamydospora]
MAFNFILPLRVAQLALAVAVLGLVAYVASWYNGSTSVASPDQVNFLIFAASWTTFLTIPYLTLSPRYFPQMAHKFGILVAEVLAMLFWFAGFIALGVFLGNLVFCKGSVCNAARAATALGAVEWLLFAATTIMATVHVVRTRRTTNEKPPPQMQYNGL